MYCREPEIFKEPDVLQEIIGTEGNKTCTAVTQRELRLRIK